MSETSSKVFQELNKALSEEKNSNDNAFLFITVFTTCNISAAFGAHLDKTQHMFAACLIPGARPVFPIMGLGVLEGTLSGCLGFLSTITVITRLNSPQCWQDLGMHLKLQ
ncbi:hypothetical protein PoB_002747600 [Plakobranchus ocellatus]|uniref:Uncharacterized protein n=1 Tax=Plakobranchus ocellatus TaxID=259542 RepID=A0AAV3ZPJ4_9GAST|nr:hypothetical protein PoB_002747600 [Plakobranchus ocellatus]